PASPATRRRCSPTSSPHATRATSCSTPYGPPVRISTTRRSSPPSRPSTTGRCCATRPSASRRRATTVSTWGARCCGARSARATSPKATSRRCRCADGFAGRGGPRGAPVEKGGMRLRVFVAVVVALVLGALAAPSVLAGNDYSDPAYTQHDLDNISRSSGRHLSDLTRPEWHEATQQATAQSYLAALGIQLAD